MVLTTETPNVPSVQHAPKQASGTANILPMPKPKLVPLLRLLSRSPMLIFPGFGFPGFLEAPGSGNQNGGGNDENASLPPIVSAPAEETGESTSVDTPDAGSGFGSEAEGITPTIPASNSASAAATTIPVSGEFDGRIRGSNPSLFSQLVGLASTPTTAKIAWTASRNILADGAARQAFRTSDHVCLPFREKHYVTFCAAHVDNCYPGYEVAEADLKRIEALLLQVAILRTYSLQNRVRTHTGVNGWLFETPDRDLPHTIWTATHQELETSSGSEEQQGRGLVDFVEGRILLHTLKSTTDHARSLLESFTMGAFYM
ncbi:pectate lyase F [Fusarium subglutinans]|uniref:Pectate lyase F n=1 Tax=Gibberella subglutinans TaxID=42677 RepID=A0A8H5UZC5_GIBSU|nr:pectate lyase F [Fusarium subglutinans]KAF5602975.1 pectate lyase F [Fusarium subglutinans]